MIRYTEHGQGIKRYLILKKILGKKFENYRRIKNKTNIFLSNDYMIYLDL